MKKVIILCLLPCLVHAITLTQVLQKRLSAFHSLQANFQQTVISEHGKILQKSSGKIAIQRPGKFYWSVLKPMKQLIIANQNKVWIYTPDLQEVMIRNLKNSISETPVILLTHTHVFLNKQFIVSKYLQNQKGEWFKLTPKKSNEVFRYLILGFRAHRLAQMQIYNQLGQHSIIEFLNVKTNIRLSPSLFIFKAPKGTDVMDQTKRSHD